MASGTEGEELETLILYKPQMQPSGTIGSERYPESYGNKLLKTEVCISEWSSTMIYHIHGKLCFTMMVNHVYFSIVFVWIISRSLGKLSLIKHFFKKKELKILKWFLQFIPKISILWLMIDDKLWIDCVFLIPKYFKKNLSATFC